MKTSGYFTPVPIVFWVFMLLVVGFVAFWVDGLIRPRFPNLNTDRAGCVMIQRNTQQAVRSYVEINSLKSGDSIDWSKIIGPGLFLEKSPSCPVHGPGAYSRPSTIPPDGVVVITCRDPTHVALVQGSWESYFSPDRVTFLLSVSGMIGLITILAIRMSRSASPKYRAVAKAEETYE